MYLDELTNKLLGVLIGITNGLFGEIKEIEALVRDSIKAIKNKDNELIVKLTNELEREKDSRLPNCKSCESPCGRTTNYYLNSIEDGRDSKISEILEFIDKYDDSVKLDVVSYNISKISW